MPFLWEILDMHNVRCTNSAVVHWSALWSMRHVENCRSQQTKISEFYQLNLPSLICQACFCPQPLFTLDPNEICYMHSPPPVLQWSSGKLTKSELWLTISWSDKYGKHYFAFQISYHIISYHIISYHIVSHAISGSEHLAMLQIIPHLFPFLRKTSVARVGTHMIRKPFSSMKKAVNARGYHLGELHDPTGPK